MTKKSKVQTPDWILEGYDSKEDYDNAKGKILGASKNSKGSSGKSKGKGFRIKLCPKCKSEDVRVAVSGEFGSDDDDSEAGKVEWECKKCKWRGSDIAEKELNEKEFEEYAERQEENLK